MNAPETAESNSALVTSVYEAYARLVKMLVPSSGCIAVYAIDGELAWGSDGFERPDFRELVDNFNQRNKGLDANQGVIRQTSAGASALIARLGNDDGEALGYLVIELSQANSNSGRSMATSMIRPLLQCLASQIALERRPAPTSEPPKTADDPRLNFVLGIGEIDLNGPNAIADLLRRCVDRLNCLSAVFCIPDLDLTEIAEKTPDNETRAQLDATRKHLLAWVQLNNRPMVVNRVDSVKAPYKILSCPVIDRDSRPVGLVALFRGADGSNFELDDVRVIEFLARQAMVLLSERQDPVSGLMIGSAFERLLDERIAGPRAVDRGTLLYIDINDLTAINGSYGYGAGDEAILRTGQLIRRSLTQREIGCRLSGDRFVVFLPERDRESAELLGEELVKSAEALGYASGGKRVPLSLRYGTAEPPAGLSAARHWIAAAELACQERAR